MTQAPSPLRLDSVTVRYENAERPTPDCASLKIEPGQVTLVLGPSGSGKSTLALAACGLIPHAVPAYLGGRVLVAGLDTHEHAVAELSTSISMVFQDPDAQIVTGTVLDEVCFGPENLTLPVGDVLSRAERALRTVGLWERREENPDCLSGGGKQRLAIACALAMRSPVIVLDEPTANLDPAGVVDVYAALAEVVADGEHSLLLIEHNLDACIDLVDQLVVIDGAGRLAMIGTVDEVLRQRSDELSELGVWMPVATCAAMQLRAVGVSLHPLPTSTAELATALDAQPHLPEPATTVTAECSAPEAPAAVRIQGLTISRQGRNVLADVNLELAPGSFLAVVGTNGAGKSTLLHALAGVRPPPRGTIRVDGIDPATASLRELSRRVGFVFQNPEHQFICDTTADELAHSLRVHSVPAQTISSRVDQMLERLDLIAERDRHPFLLSGGQKRRLSVGTALIGGARVLVLDEPTYGQDRDRAAELLDLLSLLREEGTTVIAATHDMQLVAEHATQIAVLSEGRLLAHGPTRSVLDSDALEGAGLLPPPLVTAMRSLKHHSSWNEVTRLSDLPGGDR